MQLPYFFVLLLTAISLADAQTNRISAKIVDSQNGEVLSGVAISIEGTNTSALSDINGFFEINTSLQGEHILKVELPDFMVTRIPIVLLDSVLDLGTIFLERDIFSEQKDNLITLTDSELLDDQVSANSIGLLQATRDIFLNRAAFDFGQAFFRVRGYDSQNAKVLINGIPMNKFEDGRPQWNNWGGLNDATRNQEFTHGLQPSGYHFGGILGTTNINTRPSGLRAGTRLSSSVSNRTYSGRLMVTHTAGMNKKGLAYSFSASRRWANQGYIKGTLYDAYSVFGALEYRLNDKNSINLTGIWASNRRGRSSALTQEVFNLVGKRYNPYWGEQEGEIRNSRERKIEEPILMINYFHTSNALNLNIGLAYQWGTNKRSRLAYFNAPNPDPTYYRYLPSFYVNSPIGANFISANLAKEGFLDMPQLNWGNAYTANQKDSAAYVFYNDVIDMQQVTLNTTGNLELGKSLTLDFGLIYQHAQTDNYAQIEDLLDADFHTDIDPFSDTLNDFNGTLDKREGERFSYDYDIATSQFDGFAQLRYSRQKWNAFFAVNFNDTQYQRKGDFQNERFFTNSLGQSAKVQFFNHGLKGGVSYSLNGRHAFTVNGTQLQRPPVLQNIFINPRENNLIVPEINSERVSAVDLNYYLRLPKLTARVTGFHTRFQDLTDVNFFFVDAGVGSDFVQEVLTDLDKLHMGTEIGLEYQLTSSVQLSFVAAIGKYRYASDPLVSINFDTAGAEEDLIDPEGNIDLGRAAIKDYALAQGPQKAFAFGVNYRDPKYWWVSATANFLGNNYANISTITRTKSFYLDPDTGEAFPDATDANVAQLLAQKPLDNFYLLNLVGGKSWLKKGKYISIFASVNNVFDAVFRTGGYEQSRNGNFGQLQQDNLSGTPSFAPKYWYGYGRTYFLNVAYSF